MRTSADGSIAFERKPYAPLAGSSVRLLSRDSVEKLICFRVPKGEQPADYKFGNLLGVIDEKIPFTVEASGRATGTDADAVHISRGGVPTGLVSIPIRYMHSPVELVQLDDVHACARLLAAAALRLDAETSFAG